MAGKHLACKQTRTSCLHGSLLGNSRPQAPLKKKPSMCPFAERSAEDQVLTVDESSVYQPPSQLQLPSDDVPVSNSDSAVSGPESDDNSSDNSDLLLSPGPRYADEESPRKTEKPAQTGDQHIQAERKTVNFVFLFSKADDILVYCCFIGSHVLQNVVKLNL